MRRWSEWYLCSDGGQCSQNHSRTLPAADVMKEQILRWFSFLWKTQQPGGVITEVSAFFFLFPNIFSLLVFILWSPGFVCLDCWKSEIFVLFFFILLLVIAFTPPTTRAEELKWGAESEALQPVALSGPSDQMKAPVPARVCIKGSDMKKSFHQRMTKGR